MRTFILAVTGLALGVIACSSGGTSVVEIQKTPVASISLVLSNRSLVTGQNELATATPLDASGAPLADRTVTWRSSSSTIATVTNSGMISAVSPGSAIISATSESVSAEASMSVVAPSPAPVASVSVALGAASLTSGQTTQATATTRDANNNILGGRAITWSSSNTGVASVSTSGLVTAGAPGTAQITATSEGQSGAGTLTVASPPPVPVASLSVALAASSLNPGQTTQATATARDANNNVLTGRAITWSSSNTGVATVSGSGLVTAVAVGTVQILAACEGKSGSATLAVTSSAPVPVASVSVTLGNSSLNPGLTTQAIATTRDANNNVLTGRVIAWSSNNAAVATASASGLVTAVATGNANITATSEGQSGSATLGVVDPPPPPPPGSSNEPVGMTTLQDRPFNSLNEMGWNDDGTGLSIVSDATAPKSPSNIVRIHFPAGFGEGSGTGSGDAPRLPNVRTLYVSYWGKFSSNWQGSSSGVDKTFYLYTSTGIPSVYFTMGGSGVVPKVPTISGQDILQGGAGHGDARNPDWLPNLVPTAKVALGTWHHIELVIVGNTAGAADGSIDWYLNGVHVGSNSGIQFISGTCLWNLFHYTLLYSGSSGSNPTSAQDVYFDHIYLSGK